MKPTRLIFLWMLLLCSLSAFAQADPPARVGRLSLVSGDVDFYDNYRDQPQSAQLNWPVTSQNVISTLRFAHAELQIGSTALRMESETELEVIAMDDLRIVLRLIAGSVHIRIRNPEIAPQFELRTAQGVVRLPEPGQVRVDFGTRPDATSIRVFSGSARFDSNGNNLFRK